jgi:hypothetical protein
MSKRYAFCSATDHEGLVFYQGYLSAMICSNCVFEIMVHNFDHALENILRIKKEEIYNAITTDKRSSTE